MLTNLSTGHVQYQTFSRGSAEEFDSAKGVVVLVTRRDVAELAGVSSSTVSRVLNNGYVSEDVRVRVEKAIQTLNYVPNRVAQSLRMQKLRQISCITHNIANPFYSEVLLGIEEAAYHSGYTFSLYNANFEVRDYEHVVQQGLHDGLIVMSPVELMSQLKNVMQSLPTVVLWDWSSQSPIPSVHVDLEKTMRTGVEYLAQNGHEKIVFLGMDARNSQENPRLHGYVQAMQDYGLMVDESMLQLIPKWQDNFRNGYNQMKRRLLAGLDFTAVAASNDLLAVGALRAIQESGLRVPDDVSIIGVDDIELSQMVTPSLTTVRIPKREIGWSLFELLHGLMNGDVKRNATVEHKTELVVRESVASIRTRLRAR